MKHKLWKCDELRQEWHHTIVPSHEEENEKLHHVKKERREKTKDTAENPQEFDIDCLRGMCVEIGNQVVERQDKPLRKFAQFLTLSRTIAELLYSLFALRWHFER